MAANNIYIQVDFNSQTAQQNVNALNAAIAQTGPTATKSAQQATTGLNSISVSIQQVNREFAQLTSAIAGLGISRAISGMVQMASELSRSKLAMQAFTGSAAEANKVFEQVRAIAATSPFRFKDLEETAQRLLGFGFAAKNVPYMLKEITDQAARMGTGIEGVNTIVNVFGRIMEKNFVGAMDLMRALPAQGIPAMKALGDAMEKELGHPIDVEGVRKALKDGILDPLQTIRVITESMHQKGDAAKFSDDAARAFKNLADAINNALGKLFGPDGFGPALAKLGHDIGGLLAPVGALIEKLEKLPEPEKEKIVAWAAAAAAMTAFGTALSIVIPLASPLLGLAVSITKFTASLALMNPELALTAIVLGGIGVALYKMVPEIQAFVDKGVQAIRDKLTGFIAPLQEEGKKFFAAIFGGGDAIDAKKLINTDALFETLQGQMQKHGDEAAKTLLQALSSPVEAVQAKYAALFGDLESKIQNFADEAQKNALRGILGGAQSSEMAAAQFKVDQKRIDETAKYQEEKTKGSYEAVIAYIEAIDAKDLNSKVGAIDKVTNLRIESTMHVAKIQDDALEQTFEAQAKLFRDQRYAMENLGIDVDKAIEERRTEMTAKQKLIDEKAFDESQKYRLEGWKKANDAIIEDQKRVFDAFKSMFDKLFDAFTSKHPGEALAAAFKSLALGEAKELFSSTAAAGATAAAGYGVPSEEITRGGILSQLIRRGMPPRKPMPPPGVYTPARSQSGVSYDDNTANRFATSTSTYETATMRFAVAVEKFNAGSTSKGYAERRADGGGGATPEQAAVLSTIRQRESGGAYSAQNPDTTASGAYQIIDQTWKEAAQGTGLGAQYAHAKDAPQAIQDANALWLLQHRGTKPWASSGPYTYTGGGGGGGGTGGADIAGAGTGWTPAGFSLPSVDFRKAWDWTFGPVPSPTPPPNRGGEVPRPITPAYNPDPLMGLRPMGGTSAATPPSQYQIYAQTGGATPMSMDQMMALPTISRGFMPGLYTGPTTTTVGGMSLDDMMALPAISRMSRGLPGMFGKIGAGGGINVSAISKQWTDQVSNWKKMLGFGPAPGTGSADAPDTGGSFSWSGLAGSPLAKAGAGIAGGMLAQYGLLGPAQGTGAGILSGMLGGAGLGFAVGGGPLGAAIGAAAGLGIGVGEMLAGVESPRNQAKRLANQLYHIAINNTTADQIVSLANSSYGGSVSRAMRSPEVRHMLGLFAAGTGQSMAQGFNEPHGASLVESGGMLQQQATYSYGNAYTQSSNLPTYGGVPSQTLGAPGGLSLSLNIGGQDAAKFLAGNVVSPSVVQTQFAAAMNGSNGRVAQALMMSEPGSIAS